jgi:oxygen-dependent protoporphyrinogen oxidase
MRRFPLTFFELIDLSKRIFSREHQAGRDLESWAKTHIGEAALEYLLRPFLVGVFGAQAHEISQELAFPGLSVPQGSSFFRVLRNRPKKRRAPMVAPRKGMQDFVRALELKIGNRLTLNHELRTLPQGNVAVCTDAHSAGRLLEAVEPELAMRLKQIRYSPLVSATVWANAKDFSRSPKGVGVLFAPCEQRSVLGVLFNSSSFSERTWDPKVHSFTAMLGGTLDPTAIYLSDQEIEARVRSEFASTLGWRGDQMSLKIYRWPRAVPVYSEDLRKTLEYARERLSQRKGLVLFGNYTGSVSIRGMMESTWSLRR